MRLRLLCHHFICHQPRIIVPNFFFPLEDCINFFRATLPYALLTFPRDCFLGARPLLAFRCLVESGGECCFILGGDYPRVAFVWKELPSLTLPMSSLKRSSTTLRSSCAYLRLEILRSRVGVALIESFAKSPLLFPRLAALPTGSFLLCPFSMTAYILLL
jgi:hypothetical protein